MSLVLPRGVKVPITSLAESPKCSKMKSLAPRSDTAVLISAHLHAGQVSRLIKNGDSWEGTDIKY